MARKRPYRQHLASSNDLVTPYEAVRAGFVALALEKNRRATPFIEQARALKIIAANVATPAKLVGIEEIQSALLAAAGVSDKATIHLQPQDKTEAILLLIQNFLEPAGAAFVDELVFRFLLTRGDSLGGSMRNVGGILAQRKLTRAIISSLALSERTYSWLHATNKQWVQMTDNDADIELSLRGLSWQKGRHSRTLIYNLTVPLVKNNVDLCLLDCRPEERSLAIYQTPTRYIALGELKGGIDPAGADEHWKTARTALARIQIAFKTAVLSPQIFFIGAAIERRMADEIWEQLKEEALSNAANLTDATQLASIAHWLCNL